MVESTPLSAFLGFTIPTNWGDVGTVIGGAASCIAAIIAVFAAGFARKQVLETRKIQREAGAHQAYMSYLQMAFSNPKYSGGYRGCSDEEFEQYEWYVSYMLNACEQIMMYVDKSYLWEETVKTQIAYHKGYISNNEWFKKNYKKHFHDIICKIIDEISTNVDGDRHD